MSQNIGTLITSPLRPNDTLDPIAVIFSQEAKGGHHSYPTYADMLYAQTNYPDRFEFGMLATIYADPTASNNNTYQLQYNYYSISATDSNNWIQYSGIPQTKPIEWQDSVISRTSSIPVPTASNGDRYLITGAVGGTATDYRSVSWDGHTDNIATYDSRVNYWNFTFPFEGMTVRADDERGVIYKYVGIYASSGTWIKEYVNQVYSLTASSNDGINFTAAANLVGYYKPCVFYTRFLTASVGPNMYFNINNLGSASVVKISGTTLQSNIAAGDFVTDLEYQLIWDGTQFQVPFNSSVTNIGNPEFGNTYSGGVYNYPSFQPSTAIGTAIDRFNKILAALVPSPSPDLFTQSSSILGVSARSSFGATNPNILNFNNNSVYGINSLSDAIPVSGSINTFVSRLGVFAATTSTNNRNKDIYGQLNYSVTSTTAYPSASFNNAGYLYLVVNGLTISTATLSNYLNIDTTVSGTKPGFILGSATASKFVSGVPFENFYGRTGSWFIPKASYCGPYTYTASVGLTANQYGFTRGFNNIYVIQDTTTSIITLSAMEIVLDDNPTPITLGAGSFGLASYGATNSLSGIKYYSSFQSNYTVAISNAYYNVWDDSSSAIYLADNSSSIGTWTTPFNVNDSLGTLNVSNLSYLTSFSYTKTFTINTGRRIGETVSCYIQRVNKPSLNNGNQTFTNITGSPQSMTNFYMDSNITNAASETTESFYNELRRFVSTGTYDTNSSISTPNFDSTISLQNTAAYSSELQLLNARLVYPNINYNSAPGNYNGSPVGSSPYPNPNYGISTSDYSGCSGIRYFYRRFSVGTSTSYQKFSLTVVGSATLKKYNASLSGNQIKIEIKLTGAASKQTDWLDTSQLFDLGYNPLTLGSGCSDTTPPTTIASNTWTLNVGYSGYTINNINSGGYIMLRVTTPSNWTGYITSISLTGTT